MVFGFDRRTEGQKVSLISFVLAPFGFDRRTEGQKMGLISFVLAPFGFDRRTEGQKVKFMFFCSYVYPKKGRLLLLKV